MAKYFVTLVILAFLALENNSIYSRIHAKSYPSDETDIIAHYMRQHPQHNHHIKHHSKRSNRPHHRPQQLQQQQYVASDETSSNQEEDEALAGLRRYIHLQRHFQHQQEHQQKQQQQQEHEQQHNQEQQQQAQQRPHKSVIEEKPYLRTMPRLWQHLLEEEEEYDERMYGDEPAASALNDESSSKEEIGQLPPSVSMEDEGFVESSNIPREEPNSNELDMNMSGTSIETDVSSSSHQHMDSAAKMRCPKCESSRKVEHISEEELTQLRIEFVKQQILEKLRLKERPNVSAVGLPKPIYEGTTIEEEDEKSKNKDLDDYYARTSKKFIFLQREKRECQRLGAQPSLCFSFKIDDADADGFDVNTAVLWIFKNKQNKIRHRNNTMLDQHSIVVSEVQQQLDSKYIPIVKTIAIQSVDVQDEWMKIDIEWPIKRWFGNHDLSHLIHISCQSCDINSMEEMISVDKDYRPFIMVDTQNRRRASRQKRGINCTDGVTECCREKLYISFDDIGWGDWIIQPRGYDAYFCRGSCGSVASVAQASSHHSTFLQKVMSSQRGSGRKPLELIPCCTAKQYSSLQLVFMDSNNTATQKTFPNMVVESCGCR